MLIFLQLSTRMTKRFFPVTCANDFCTHILGYVRDEETQISNVVCPYCARIEDTLYQAFKNTEESTSWNRDFILAHANSVDAKRSLIYYTLPVFLNFMRGENENLNLFKPR
jgi:hypothetical protein